MRFSLRVTLLPPARSRSRRWSPRSAVARSGGLALCAGPSPRASSAGFSRPGPALENARPARRGGGPGRSGTASGRWTRRGPWSPAVRRLAPPHPDPAAVVLPTVLSALRAHPEQDVFPGRHDRVVLLAAPRGLLG